MHRQLDRLEITSRWYYLSCRVDTVHVDSVDESDRGRLFWVVVAAFWEGFNFHWRHNKCGKCDSLSRWYLFDIDLIQNPIKWDSPSLSEYILFSKAVLGGPMIIPVQFFRSMSSSFSRPQLNKKMSMIWWRHNNHRHIHHHDYRHISHQHNCQDDQYHHLHITWSAEPTWWCHPPHPSDQPRAPPAAESCGASLWMEVLANH